MIIQTEDHLFLRDETRHPCCAEGRSANNENTAAGGRWPVLSRATRPRHYLAVLPRKKSEGDRNERLLKITASSDRSSPPIFLDIFVFATLRWLRRSLVASLLLPSMYQPYLRSTNFYVSILLPFSRIERICNVSRRFLDFKLLRRSINVTLLNFRDRSWLRIVTYLPKFRERLT